MIPLSPILRFHSDTTSRARRHFKNDLARKLYNQDHEYLKSLVTKFQPLLLKSFVVHQQPLLLSPEVDEWKRDRADVTLNELTK